MRSFSPLDIKVRSTIRLGKYYPAFPIGISGLGVLCYRLGAGGICDWRPELAVGGRVLQLEAVMGGKKGKKVKKDASDLRNA